MRKDWIQCLETEDMQRNGSTALRHSRLHFSTDLSRDPRVIDSVFNLEELSDRSEIRDMILVSSPSDTAKRKKGDVRH